MNLFTHFTQTAFSENLFPPRKEGWELWNWKNDQNLTCKGIGHKFLQVPPSLQSLNFFSVLLCHNLDLSMLKSEGSLT